MCIAARATPAGIWGTFVCTIREGFLDSRFAAWSGRKARKRRNEFLERNFTRNSRNLERCWNARFDIVQGRRNTAKAFNDTNACVSPRNIEFYPVESKNADRSFSRLETGPLSFCDKVTIFVSKERCSIEISLFINRLPFIYILETVLISLFTHTLMFISVV